MQTLMVTSGTILGTNVDGCTGVCYTNPQVREHPPRFLVAITGLQACGGVSVFKQY